MFFFIHYECESPLMASAQFISLIYNSRPFASFPRDAVCRTHTQNTPLNMAADCTMYYVCIVHTMHHKALSYYHHNSLIMARHALSIRGRWQPNNLLRHLLLDKGPLTRVSRQARKNRPIF